MYVLTSVDQRQFSLDTSVDENARKRILEISSHNSAEARLTCILIRLLDDAVLRLRCRVLVGPWSPWSRSSETARPGQSKRIHVSVSVFISSRDIVCGVMSAESDELGSPPKPLSRSPNYIKLKLQRPPLLFILSSVEMAAGRERRKKKKETSRDKEQDIGRVRVGAQQVSMTIFVILKTAVTESGY